MRAAPHALTADSACLGSPRLQVGPAAWDVSNPGRYSVLGTYIVSKLGHRRCVRRPSSPPPPFLLLPRP